MNKSDIFSTIVEHTREVVFELEDHEFKQDDSLKALGANSIDRSEILMMTLESLDIKMPLLALAKAVNIDEIAGILHARL
ncbi:MAG: acyl carrier protein [Algicola sp.]|nr:acyl carrier protein [Algicola sp.]